jgi:hypothetical protein
MPHDTLQVIHDTLYIKGYENIEIIGKIDSMYNNAWVRLIATITILALVLPVVVSWFLQREYKKSNKIFEEQINDLKKSEQRVNGFMAHMQAEFSRITSETNAISNHAECLSQAISDYLSAIKYYINGGDSYNISRCLSALLYCANALFDDDRKKLSRRTDIRKDVEIINSGIPNNLRPDFERIRDILNPSQGEII